MDIIRNSLLTGFTADLTVSQHGFVTTDNTWVQPPLPAPYSRIYFVTDGFGQLLSERESIQLEPGYVYLAPCGLPCGFSSPDSVTKLYFHINIILPNGYDLFLKASGMARLPYPVEKTRHLQELYLSEDPAKHILLKGKLWKVVADFAQEIIPNRLEKENPSARTAQAIAYIHTNLSAGMTVKAVADALFCSETTLETVFRREIGSTVGRYIEDMVLFEAQQLLLSTEKSVGEISAILGFSDQFYFSRRFHKHFSVSPKAYRSLHMR